MKLITHPLDPDRVGYGLYLYQSVPALNFKLDPADEAHRCLVTMVLSLTVDPARRQRLLRQIYRLARRLGLASHAWDGAGVLLASDLDLRVGAPPWGKDQCTWVRDEAALHRVFPAWAEPETPPGDLI